MKKATAPNGLLIVLELGAEWPSSLLAELSERPMLARRVLVQEEIESSGAYAVRVGELLGGVFGHGAGIGTAVVACSERLDAAASAARAELVRAAAGTLARQGGGCLLLASSDRNEGRSRPAFNALTRELAGEWRSAAVEVKLHFAGEREAPDESPRAGAPTRRARSKDTRRVA